jgi:hypothetical protein
MVSIVTPKLSKLYNFFRISKNLERTQIKLFSFRNSNRHYIMNEKVSVKGDGDVFLDWVGKYVLGD